MRKNISTRLFVMMLAIVFFGIFAIGTVSFVVFRQSIREMSIEAMTSAVNLQSEQISEWLEHKNIEIDAAASKLSLDTEYGDNQRPYFAAILENDSDFFETYLGLPNGMLISGSGWVPDYAGGYAANQRSWYKGAAANPNVAYITEPYTDSQTGKLCITIARAVVKENNIQGVFAADLYIDVLQDTVLHTTKELDSYAFLVGATGNILIHANEAYSPTVDASGNESFPHITEGGYAPLWQPDNAHMEMVDTDGIKKHFISATISATGWKIFTAVPTYVADASLTKNALMILPLYVIVLLIALLLISVEIRKNLIRPIKGVLSIATEIGSGNLNVNIPTNYRGEFGVLALSFKNISESLHALRDDALTIKQAAMHGNLTVRADVTRHEGDFKIVVEGINDIVEVLTVPIHMTSDIMKNMEQGNLDARIEGTYAGVYAELQTTINTTLESLQRYINEVGDTLASMASGDLTAHITSEYKGHFIELKNAINAIGESLSIVFNSISTASEQVAAGTQQVSDGAQATAQGATEQAGNIQELTATILQITDQINSTSKETGKVNQAAITTQQKADAGNEQMAELQIAMQQIDQSSRDISKIIKVIDDIAFQTNILALNAAVEAARAGIHGKGFAVVAEEVRNLAAKSADAAKETTVLIETSVERSQTGTMLAEKTTASLREISDMVVQAVEALGHITSATDEQAVAVLQVNKAIEHMSGIVQTNSATAEQAAAAAEELSNQADLLKQEVGKFRFSATQNAREIHVLPQIKPPIQRAPLAIPKPEMLLNDIDFGKY